MKTRKTQFKAVIQNLFHSNSAVLLQLMLVILTTMGLNSQAYAGSFEFSQGFGFNRSVYSSDSYSWTRKWGLSFGYHFTDRSGIEVAFSDSVDRTHVEGVQDTEFHDQIYSVDWIQDLLGRESPVQPYFKVGFGQLNRDASGTYANGAQPIRRQDSLTVILGAGLRIYLLRNFAIRSEATSYLVGGRISTWEDNIAITVGTSLFF